MKQLPQFPLKTSTIKILPALMDELKNAPVVSFLLPSIFWYDNIYKRISDRLESLDFIKNVYPKLKTIVFKIVDPPQATLLTLHKIKIFSKNLDDELFRIDVVPFISECITCSNQQVQILSLNTIAIIQSKIDFLTLKNNILPKINVLID